MYSFIVIRYVPLTDAILFTNKMLSWQCLITYA